MKAKWIILLCSILATNLLSAKTWLVGANRNYKKPSEVSGLAQDGDTVLIDPGIYPQDVCLWRARRLLIKGVSQFAHLKSGGRAYGQKAIWVIQGDSTIIENIEFSECAVPDRNGAGIRLEATHLVVRNCYFHDNQEGILAGDNPLSDVIIEYCEFSGNGFGDGLSHNLYINHVRSLTFRFNYSHDSRVGHLLKSRAYKNIIQYNFLNTGNDNGSYEIDLPNGGQSVAIGNIIIQGPNSQNSTFISYGKEGLSNPGPHDLILAHNTLVNRKGNGTFVNLQSGTDKIILVNNVFAGNGTVKNGSSTVFEEKGNLIHPNISFFRFENEKANDYRLAKGSPAIHAGIVPEPEYQGLSPDYEFHSLNKIISRKKEYLPDAGAFERHDLNPFITPVQGVSGRDYLLTSYPDLGLNEISDNHCLDKTTKKNKGTFYTICGYERMYEGVEVIGVDSGVVIALRDGLSDESPAKDSSEYLGNYVVVKHAGGWMSIYGKLKQNSIRFKIGDNIQGGSPIALVGCSGDCEDPHLYFELKLDSSLSIDPHDGPCGNNFGFWKNPTPYDSSFFIWKSGLISGPSSIHAVRRNQAQIKIFDLGRDSIVEYWNLIHGLRKGDEYTVRWYDENGSLKNENTYWVDRNLWHHYHLSGIPLSQLGTCRNCRLEYWVNREKKDEITFAIQDVSSGKHVNKKKTPIHQNGRIFFNITDKRLDYSIWSTWGQCLNKGSFPPDKSIDLNHLQTGIYYLAISDTKEHFETMKIILQ